MTVLASRQGIARALVFVAWLAYVASSFAAEERKPKLGSAAISLQQSHDYLQTHRAPDYWALSPYYQAASDSAGQPVTFFAC